MVFRAITLFFPQHDSELGFAGFAGIIEGGTFAVTLGDAKKETLLRAVGETEEAGFALGIGSDLEVELVQVHESVSDVDADVGGVDGLTLRVGNGEIGGAGAEAGIDFGDGFGVRLGIDRRDGVGVRGE